MSTSSNSIFCIDPIIQPDKKFIFNGKEFPIDFNLIKLYSLYYKKNHDYYEGVVNIKIEEPFDISNDEFQAFVDCCQKQNVQITDSNIFALNYLSIRYEVPSLTQFTENYIETNYSKLVFQSLHFKQSHEDVANYPFKNLSKFFNTEKEEKIICKHLNEYLEDERLLSLQIPIIDRIMKKYFEINKGKNDPEAKKLVAEFLIKYLKKHGKEASIIFLNVDFENADSDLIIQLQNECAEIFDFNMINSKSLFKTTYDLLSELKRNRIELNKIIQEQKEELSSFKKIKSDFYDKIMKMTNEENSLNEKLILFEENQKKFIEKQEFIECTQNNIGQKQQETTQICQQLVNKQNYLEQQLAKQKQQQQSFQDSLNKFSQKSSNVTNISVSTNIISNFSKYFIKFQ